MHHTISEMQCDQMQYQQVVFYQIIYSDTLNHLDIVSYFFWPIFLSVFHVLSNWCYYMPSQPHPYYLIYVYFEKSVVFYLKLLVTDRGTRFKDLPEFHTYFSKIEIFKSWDFDILYFIKFLIIREKLIPHVFSCEGVFLIH